MTNAKIGAEMERVKPELILLKNNSSERPFGHLLLAEYQLVYEGQEHRLYALRAVARSATC